VRQAMALAIDREAVAEARGADYTHPNGQVTNAGVAGHIDGFGFEFDLDAAKQLMAESGYPDGFSLTILSESILDGQSLIAQSMIANFGELGIDVQLQVEPDVPTFIGTAGSAQYSAVLWPIVGTKTSQYTGNYNGGGFLNSFGVFDDELTALQAETNVGTPEEQLAAQEELTKRSNELAWFIPVVATDSVFYVSADLENVVASALNPNPMPIGPSAEFAWHPAG
jgi:peptide/nickel transport system substrate-binding protein